MSSSLLVQFNSITYRKSIVDFLLFFKKKFVLKIIARLCSQR